MRLYSVYGSTEHAPHTMTTSQDPDERVLSTDGCACAGAEVRIVDPVTRTVLPAGAEGEEASRGPAVFSGYLGRPDLTGKVLDDEGWYYSGDLAVMDAEGYIRISGRRKDLIIRGGENISPSEVEGVLMGHPAIAAATVVPVPDPVLGERALACIVRRPGAPKIDVPALREWFIDQGVAKFKIPEYVEHLEEMSPAPARSTGSRSDDGRGPSSRPRHHAADRADREDPISSEGLPDTRRMTVSSMRLRTCAQSSPSMSRPKARLKVH